MKFAEHKPSVLLMDAVVQDMVTKLIQDIFCHKATPAFPQFSLPSVSLRLIF
jgi:hypothetical protein